MGSAKTVGKLLQEADVRPESITAQQREFIENKISEIRKGRDPVQAQREIYDMLKAGSAKITSQAENQAIALEKQADQILKQAESQKAAITPEIQNRISNLKSQLENAADKIRSEAEIKAKFVLDQAEKKAAEIRANSANQSKSVREIAEVDAKDALSQARKQADDLRSRATAQASRLSKYRDRVLNITKETKGVPSKSMEVFGEPVLPTPRGEKIRSGFEKVLNDLKTKRDEVITNLKKPVFDAALEKEKSGFRAKSTKAYQQAIKDIDNALINPDTELNVAGVPEIAEQLKKVKKWLDPKTAIKEETGVAIAVPDVSFEGLEKIRRFLRDRSYGLPAEGYDAISQKQAGKLADSIENIMEEFSPGFKAYKDAYKEASKPINELKTKLGRSITDKPEGFDLGQYVMDASKLGAKVFDSKGTVQQLISVLGKDEAEQIAKGYIADALRKPTSTNLESFITKNRDWIDQFPNLDRKSTRLNSSHTDISRMPSSA